MTGETLTLASMIALPFGALTAWIAYMAKKTPDETKISSRLMKRIEEIELRSDKQLSEIHRLRNELLAATGRINGMSEEIADLKSEVNSLLVTNGQPKKYP